MSPHDQSRVERLLSRHIVTGELSWLALMSRMRRSLGNPREPRRAAPAGPAPIQKNDFVRIQRDLVVGPHRIASGSVGTVVVIHDHRPLVDVAFGDEPISVTVAGYELMRVAAAG